MSNIYVQEPPTHGKVLMITNFGEVDIELWSKEAPRASRNFVQLCMEGYYDNTTFHRIEPYFIAQGGDPTGTGNGGESIYGGPFKDEIHSRLRFNRRGLVAMASSEKDKNGSQFFFTLGPCQELNDKHTIFGTVRGDTLYNVLKLNDTLMDANGVPVYGCKVIKTEVLNNPFPDIVPRHSLRHKRDADQVLEESDARKKQKGECAAVKNFSLLSFGAEAREDEVETAQESKKYSDKGKSSHDLLNDPMLSSAPAVSAEELASARGNDTGRGEASGSASARLSDVYLEGRQREEAREDSSDSDSDIDFGDDLKMKYLKLIRKEQKSLKKLLTEAKSPKQQQGFGYQQQWLAGQQQGSLEGQQGPAPAQGQQGPQAQQQAAPANQMIMFNTPLSPNIVPWRPQGEAEDREELTMSLLEKFKSKLSKKEGKKETDEKKKEDKGKQETSTNDTDDFWMSHVLQFEGEGAVVAKDANVKSDDWFEIYDPRNPINKRRREMKKSGSPQERQKRGRSWDRDKKMH